MVVERMKRNAYRGESPNYYFWRTYDHKEVDFVEEKGGELSACQFSYAPGEKDIPRLWSDTYPKSQTQVITTENVPEFLG